MWSAEWEGWTLEEEKQNGPDSQEFALSRSGLPCRYPGLLGSELFFSSTVRFYWLQAAQGHLPLSLIEAQVLELSLSPLACQRTRLKARDLAPLGGEAGQGFQSA